MGAFLFYTENLSLGNKNKFRFILYFARLFVFLCLSKRCILYILWNEEVGFTNDVAMPVGYAIYKSTNSAA